MCNLYAKLLRMRRGHLIVALAICLLAHGCSNLSGPYLSPAASHAMPKVKVGMLRDDVIVLLGEPQTHSFFGKTELMTYKPDWSLADPDSYNPIAIENGKVVGVGVSYVRKVEAEAAGKSAFK